MKKLISFIMVVIIIVIMPFSTALAAKEPLDEIQNYTISVDMLSDGNAKINYHFNWKVLDSDSEGPLEYLFVGIPNKHVENITALSDNIKSIEYTSSSDNGSGDFVRIDFYRSYYKEKCSSSTFP